MKTLEKLQNIPLAVYIVGSVGLILVYTVLEFIFATITGISHDTLTTCVYAFFGTEIASCAFIKVYKIKKDSFFSGGYYPDDYYSDISDGSEDINYDE